MERKGEFERRGRVTNGEVIEGGHEITQGEMGSAALSYWGLIQLSLSLSSPQIYGFRSLL